MAGTTRRAGREQRRSEHLDKYGLAERLGVSVRTVEDWRATGAGPRALKVGGILRYRMTDVLDWEQAHLSASTSERSA